MLKNTFYPKKESECMSASFLRFNRTVPLYASTHQPCPNSYLWEQYISSLIPKQHKDAAPFEAKKSDRRFEY